MVDMRKEIVDVKEEQRKMSERCDEKILKWKDEIKIILKENGINFN
jgi:hypothetical protein